MSLSSQVSTSSIALRQLEVRYSPKTEQVGFVMVGIKVVDIIFDEESLESTFLPAHQHQILNLVSCLDSESTGA